MTQEARTAEDVTASIELSVVRMLVAGGTSALAVYVACWIAAQLPASSPTHAFISLFTSAEVTSGAALVEGGVWAMVFGAFVTSIFSLIYNLTAPLTRR